MQGSLAGELKESERELDGRRRAVHRSGGRQR
jgi:hypothetical protein